MYDKAQLVESELVARYSGKSVFLLIVFHDVRPKSKSEV